MKFTFEEAELINNFFEESSNVTKEFAVSELNNAKDNTDDTALVEIAQTTIDKITALDDQGFTTLFSSLPVDPYTEF